MQLVARAKQWAQADPDPATKEELLRLIEAAQAGDEDAKGQLKDAFSGPLQFGTAGLRGALGPGESCMNEAVVVRATAGLMAWLNSKVATPKVVIGCDARYGSAQFAEAAAEVVIAAGGQALKLAPAQPTPITAFAVRKLGADAAVMVTASHNPARDNGYKVYLGGRIATGPAQGVQIIPPADAQIAEAIAGAKPAHQVPRSRQGIVAVDVAEEYLRAVATPSPQHDLKIVLTPMHGVGGTLCRKALQRAGFADVTVVAAQADPDPDFPTVAFPNPEEDGALDLAFETATQVGADLIIAVDPDADRCAVAIPAGQGFRQLSGDEAGALLGNAVAEQGGSGTLATSIVSSRLLGEIARANGLNFVQTLTGFKWIARTPNLLYGYEEAIGHCPAPALVRDKDGIATAVAFARLAAKQKDAGKTLQDALAELARRFGLYQTAPLTFRVDSLPEIERAMERLRENPPAALAGAAVNKIEDLSGGTDTLPPANVLILQTEANDRVVIRPSGTEPKLKCYLEVVLPAGDEVPYLAAKQRLERVRAEVSAACGL